MARLITLPAVAASVICVAAAAAGGGALGGRIVFAASDAPNADDVMLVQADGTTLDLSNSPAADSAPVLSPDGKLVAFFSTRGGRGAEYVVATDGSALRQVTPQLADPPYVVWAPDSATVTVLTGAADLRSAIHGASARGGVWKLLDRGDQPLRLVGWSPDGSRLAYVTSLGVEVVTSAGRRLLDLIGTNASWSPTGRLAVQRNSASWRVYDARGRRVSDVPATSVAWSGDDRLASITQAGLLQVRLHGAGPPTVSVHLRRAGDPRWLDATRLRLQGANGSIGYDLARHVTFALPPGYASNSAVAPGGQEAFGEAAYGTLVLSTLAGQTRTVASVPYCQGRNRDAFDFLQVLPDGSGAVYASSCAQPHDLFAVDQSGSGLTRLTSTPVDELSPAVSPDRSQVAFARVQSADCQGCDETLWVMNADGSQSRAFPLGTRKHGEILQNDHPSFSPDGKTILFDRWNSGVSEQSSLFEVPATGGTSRPLRLTGGTPVWGPTRIAFDGGGTIKTAAPDGSDVKPVAGAKQLGGAPAWSQDGRLAILQYTQPSLSIFVASTGKRIALPGFHAASFLLPGIAWSPDGTRLAFVAADTEDIGDVWTIGVDGSGLSRITHGLGAAGTLSWR